MKHPSKRSIFIITGIVSVLLTTGIVLFLLTRPSFTLKSDAPSVIEAGSEFDPLDFVDTVNHQYGRSQCHWRIFCDLLSWLAV